jgi:hypothetical protein
MAQVTSDVATSKHWPDKALRKNDERSQNMITSCSGDYGPGPEGIVAVQGDIEHENTAMVP